MPSVPRRADRRAFYLDTSTLSDAFRGLHPAFMRKTDPPACAELGKLVTRIAGEANLCLTTMHVMEFARNEDIAFGDALIRWIDSLDTVWMMGMQHVRQDENEVALQRAVGFEARTAVELYAPSMLRAFERLQMDEFNEAINGRTPLLNVFAAARIHGGKAQDAEMANIIRTFRYDRREDPTTQNLTKEQKAAIVDAKLRENLKLDAFEAYERLKYSADVTVDFHNRCRFDRSPYADAFVDYVLSNPKQLPSFHVTREYASHWADVAAAKEPGSKKEAAERASFYDHAHMAIGAAYCDVFTCDRRTAKCFGGTREDLGFRAAHVMSGDGFAFVKALADEAVW